MLRLRVRLILVFAAAALAAPSVRAAAPAHHADTRDGLLWSVDRLAARMTAPNLVLFQIGPKATYDAGHIKGAQLLSLDEISAPMAHAPTDTPALSLEMPSTADLQARLRAAGVTNNSQIVVYFSDGYVSPATRAIYTLTWAGLGDRTALLQGGLDAWKRAGQPVTTEAPTITPGTLTLGAPHADLVVTIDAAKAARTAAHTKLVDGRTAGAYDGVPPATPPPAGRPPQPLGHIPGAVSVPYVSAYDEADNLRAPAELEALFAKAGVAPGDTIVGYCWIGQQATAMLFAARTLGHPVKLYDGSINDWTNRKEPLEVVKK